MEPLPPAGDDGASYRHMNQMRKELRNSVDPFNLPPRTFIKKFRLSKALVRELIQDVSPYIHFGGHGGALTVETKVFAALRFHASGSYQGLVGESWLHCLGRSTTGQCVREVTRALNEPQIQRKWIKFPKSKRERKILTNKHERKFGIPGVVGFIDGTEISIVTPPKPLNAQAYWTRKNHYALNCQVICDSDLNIMNIKPSHPGSCNDKFIFKGSAARRRMVEAYNEEPCWLLGDSGYTDEPWVVTPILDAAEGSDEEAFTKQHCKARNCVERCIGVLKSRFRCLLKARALHYHPERAAAIVKACAVLHNMCMSARPRRPALVEGEEEPLPAEGAPFVVVDEDDDDEEEPVDAHPGNQHLRRIAQVVRQRLVAFLAVNAAERQLQELQQQDDEGDDILSDDDEREYGLIVC